MRQTCLNMIYELAKDDERILFIGSDLGVGTLDQFREEMPNRFFMEGVLPETGALFAAIMSGANTMMEFPDDTF